MLSFAPEGLNVWFTNLGSNQTWETKLWGKDR